MEQNIVNTAPEWVCDSPEKADWAIEKIKECRERRDLYIAAAESRISQLKDQIEQSKEDCDSQTSYLMGALDSYLDMVPAKKSKTQISLDLPSGKIVRKLEHPDYVKNEPALLRYLQEHDPDMVTYTPKIKWADLKKCLSIVDGMVIRSDTGEVIDADCISIEIVSSKTDVK